MSATTPPALGPGTTVPRRRALMGLLDADGWAWATTKAAAWLVVLILMLAYIPDRAYYFTVNRTLDLGLLVWSPINFCPPENETLPCPAPAGAIVPWHPSPPELALPAPRTDGTVVTVGTKMLYIGGSDGSTASADVFVAEIVQTGNFDTWALGPALPEPRSDAAVVAVSGTIYVLGGYDAVGTPMTTVFALTPDPGTGALPDWEILPELELPEGRAEASGIVSIDGILLVGGVGPDDSVVNTTWKSKLTELGTLEPWDVEAPLVRPQAGANGSLAGEFLWLWGGHDTSGPVGAVQRGTIGEEAPEGEPENPDEGKVVEWGVSDSANLPVARDDAAGWAANGALYLVGGADLSGQQAQTYWTVPTAEGDITGWHTLEQNDLPVAASGGTAAILGPNVVIVGGWTGDTVLDSSVRANTAPLTPFFQLGIAGMTVPALRIEGEIGQQLGYLNAAGAGTVNFIVLVVIGWAFAHKTEARAAIRRILRRG